MVVSMLVNSLYNIVDSFFVAKISENAMTALSLVFPVQNLINAVMIGFGIGINAVISFYLGAADQKKADQAASQGMLLGTFHGILLMIICLVVIHPFLSLFTNDAEIINLGLRYSKIVFLFSVFFAWDWFLKRFFKLLVNEYLHDLSDERMSRQHFSRSGSDFWTGTISFTRDRGCCPCHRSRTDIQCNPLSDFLYGCSNLCKI